MLTAGYPRSRNRRAAASTNWFFRSRGRVRTLVAREVVFEGSAILVTDAIGRSRLRATPRSRREGPQDREVLRPRLLTQKRDTPRVSPRRARPEAYLRRSREERTGSASRANG